MKKEKKNLALIRLEDQPPVEAEILDVSFSIADEDVDFSSLLEVTDPELTASLMTFAPKRREEGKTYRALVPAGSRLVPSKNVQLSGLRALWNHGPIRSRPTFIRITALGSPVSAGFAVASLLVGQHYLEEISRHLDRLYCEVSDVNFFLTGELESKTKTLALSLCSLASHQQEILRNKELRFRELGNLDEMQRESETLLNQCTLSLSKIADREEKDFTRYAHDVAAADEYLKCQSVLAEVLGHVVELKYTLNLGRASLDYCKGNYERYINEAMESRKGLADFHRHHIDTLKIQPDSMQVQRDGIFFKALRLIPKFQKTKVNYKAMDENLAGTINAHLGEDLYAIKSTDKDFDKDIEIFIKDDRVYQKEPENKE